MQRAAPRRAADAAAVATSYPQRRTDDRLCSVRSCELNTCLERETTEGQTTRATSSHGVPISFAKHYTTAHRYNVSANYCRVRGIAGYLRPTFRRSPRTARIIQPDIIFRIGCKLVIDAHDPTTKCCHGLTHRRDGTVIRIAREPPGRWQAGEKLIAGLAVFFWVFFLFVTVAW